MTNAITFLGQSGLDIHLGASRIVCDPWLSRRGAYMGAWHQFPDNARLGSAALYDTPTVFISSPFPDRFDPETLVQFPKTTRVIVPAFPSPTLTDRLSAMGFSEVVALADWQPFDLGGGVRLQVITDPAKQILRSTLVLESPLGVVVSQADCELDPASASRIAELRPAVHFIQVSGITYAPAVYQLSAEQATAHRNAAVESLWRRFTGAFELGARAVVAVPSPALLEEHDGSLALSSNGALLDAEHAVARLRREAPALAERVYLLRPGDVVEGGRQSAGQGAGQEWRFPPAAPAPSRGDGLDGYLREREPLRQKALAELRLGAAPVEAKELRAYLRDLFQFEDMTWDMKDVLVCFQTTEGVSVWVDFRKRPIRYLTECGDPPNVVLTVDAAWMSLVLQGKLGWQDLLFGRLVKMRREPDRDCPGLMLHLEYRSDAALFELLRRLNPATITVQDESMEYVCQRFCPHRGRDLEYGIIERGVLTCTAHGWRFDLRRGGKCVWGGDTPLVVKEIRPLKP